MNIVFWALLIVFIVTIWFLASMLFKPLGSYLFKIWKDTIENMEIDEKDEEEKK